MATLLLNPFKISTVVLFSDRRNVGRTGHQLRQLSGAKMSAIGFFGEKSCVCYRKTKQNTILLSLSVEEVVTGGSSIT